jgi:hypothetical protein
MVADLLAFLIEMSRDCRLLEAFRQDPVSVARVAGLDEADIAALLQGDSAISEALLQARCGAKAELTVIEQLLTELA